MKKNHFFAFAAGLSFFLFLFTACSQQITQKTTSISINFSDDTFRGLLSKLEDRAADDTVSVNCEVILTVDGQALPPQSKEIKINGDSEEQESDDQTEFIFPNIPLGSTIQASASFLIGELKYAGQSEEKPLQQEELYLPITVSLVEETEEEPAPDDKDRDGLFTYKIKFKFLKDGLNESDDKADYELDESLTISGSFLSGWQSSGDSEEVEAYLNDTLYEKLMDLYSQGYQILEDDEIEPDYSYNPFTFSTTITYYCVKKDILLFASGSLADDNLEFIGYAEEDQDGFFQYLVRSEKYGKYAFGIFYISENSIHCYESYTFNHKNLKLTPVSGGNYYEIDSTLGETFEYTSNNGKTITFTVRE